ncbi:gliding motility-associated ABC transporter substrate-binding protein GldG [Flavobacteriaceae bacterium]|nr:gliding motility-associated ABC transporter substrate-binding protein GldG [Flavobacteriaceae bacterium]
MRHFKKPFLLLLILILIVGLSRNFFLQIDLTYDKRNSLSKSTLTQIKELKDPLRIDVFLSGDLPSTYLRFRNEIDALLSNLKYHNNNILINYNDPFELGEPGDVVKEMQKYGMQPEIVFENINGNRKESFIYPWLMINYGNRSELVQLLQKQLGDTENEKIIRSVKQLEYQIMDGIHKVRLKEKKSIAILSSHKTSENIKITDLLQNLKPYYNLAAFNLKNSELSSKESLKNLNRFDLLIISNAKKPFSQNEKYILDQYGLAGGKLLWMLNGMAINRDSLFNQSGMTYGFPQELNLNDYFFHKGVRLQKTLVQDLYCAPIVLANNNENQTQYLPYPWVFYPISEPESTMIGKDIGPVLSKFTSSIDTISNALSKTLLLKSSDFTKTPMVPTLIKLEQATEKIKPANFNETSKAFGYQIQGKQNSLFYNRIKPFEIEEHLDVGETNIILFSDGNLAENQIEKGNPLTLGYDKWTNNFYANRRFLMNSIHFLIGNEERLTLREKFWKFALLDSEKLEKNAKFLKWLILLVSIAIGIVLSLINKAVRSKHLLS